MEKWMISAKKADFQGIAERFHIDQVTARLIRNRDVVGDGAVEEYLHGNLSHLHDPWLLKGMDRSAEILESKIREGRKLRVIGDYDIDGVNATYILYRGLCACNAIVDMDIPDRMKDGYGINEHLIQRAFDCGVDTIVTCDNGIAAVKEIAYAKELGMTVVVTDHHEPQETVPQADAIINPKQDGCTYPYKNLCGASVALKLIQCLYERFEIPPAKWEPFLENAAFATVGDVVDLTGENRILVREGLKRLNHTENIGLRALISVNSLTESMINSYHLGFVLGPCINASGRLDTAKKAVKLLLAEDSTEAMALANDLKELNDERKDMTQKGLLEAVDMINSSELSKDRVLVVYLPSCHESLAGIIAGRIRERYYRPVFVLTEGEEGVKGSGRSIETYNMFEELCKVSDLFTKFGGHPMAAGLSLPKENVDIFRRRINEGTSLTEEDLIPKIMIDVPMPLDYISEKLVEELSVLEPFGKANTKPLFADRKLRIRSARVIGRNRNVLKMQVQNAAGCVMEALYFGDLEVFQGYVAEKFGESELERLLQGRESDVSLSMTYYPSINEFRGNRTLQIVVQNYQ